jgi:hypothetical protein
MSDDKLINKNSPNQIQRTLSNDDTKFNDAIKNEMSFRVA